jgi:hypothetical protein
MIENSEMKISNTSVIKYLWVSEPVLEVVSQNKASNSPARSQKKQ